MYKLYNKECNINHKTVLKILFYWKPLMVFFVTYYVIKQFYKKIYVVSQFLKYKITTAKLKEC